MLLQNDSRFMCIYSNLKLTQRWGLWSVLKFFTLCGEFASQVIPKIEAKSIYIQYTYMYQGARWGSIHGKWWSKRSYV